MIQKRPGCLLEEWGRREHRDLRLWLDRGSMPPTPTSRETERAMLDKLKRYNELAAELGELRRVALAKWSTSRS
jgi:hypothetical protein